MILLETEKRESTLETCSVRHGRTAMVPGYSRHNRRVMMLRRAVADGMYETPEKLELMLDRLIEDLLSNPRARTVLGRQVEAVSSPGRPH